MKRKDANGLEHKQVGFKADKVSDDGTFSGYGSVFGNVDSYDEIVAPGAFKESLSIIKSSGDPLPVLWQHNPAQPIGGYTELSEDSTGLKVAGFLLKDDVALAREAYALMRKRVVKGLSIGYYVRADSFDEKTGIRTLHEVDLREISVVTFPANVQARVEAVKAVTDSDVEKAVRWLKKAIKLHEGHMDGSVSTSEASQKEMMMQMEKALTYLTGAAPSMSGMSAGVLPNIRMFEDFLREAGFSKTQAAFIANNGLSKLHRGEPDGTKGDDVLQVLSNFKLTL